jgi:hypothetical protein
VNFVPTNQATSFRWECAATGRTADKEGVFQTNRRLAREAFSTADPEVFLSAAAVKEMARKLGWFPPDEIAELQARFDEQGDVLAELKDRLDKIDQYQALEKELTHA